MANISVYLNNSASSVHRAHWADGLRRKLFRHQVNVREPGSIEELQSQVRSDLESGVEVVFSVGGDGTANCIMQELVGTTVKFFIVPAGTANDLANQLGITNSIDQIIKIYHYQTLSTIDVIRVNHRYMATNGGLGFAKNVAENVNRYRKVYPWFRSLMSVGKGNIYAAVILKELMTVPLRYYSLGLASPNLPASLATVVTPLLTINNVPILANQFPIAPATNNSDGHFNVSLFTHASKIDFLKCVLRIRMGELPIDDPDFWTFETEKLQIMHLGDGPIGFFGDGEIMDEGQRYDIEIVKRALTIFKVEDDFFYEHSYDLNTINLV